MNKKFGEEMLTPRAVTYLKPLVYDAGARRRVCVLPLGGIYWDDEIPDFHALMEIPESDRLGIYSLFRIRFKIWDGLQLTGDDGTFWEAAREQVPDYALFRRLDISDDDRRVQEETERKVEEGFAALGGDADEVTVTEKDGFQSFSATFDLTKSDDECQPPKPWWKRIFRA